MTRDAWFYAQNDTEHGPISLEELRGMVRSGSIRREDLVWHDGMEHWQPASQIEELNGSTRAPLSSLLAIPQTAMPSGTIPLLAPPLGRLLVLLSLFVILTAEGCERLGARYGARTAALLRLEKAEFDDDMDRRREKLIAQRDALREDGVEASEREKLDAIIEQINDLATERSEAQAELEKGRWKSLATAARDADSKRQVWSFWRAGLVLLGTLVLATGLLILGATAHGAEQWLAWGMLIVLLFLRLGS